MRALLHTNNCFVRGQTAQRPRHVHASVLAREVNEGSAVSELRSLPYAPRNGAGAPKCVPAAVEVLEKDGDTIFKIEVPDYPGLLRVISWVINGMDLRVKAASLRTQDNGVALDMLTVTTMTGDPLSKKRAKEAAERLADFVMYCSPSPKSRNPESLSSDGVVISHTAHDKFTVITVVESEDSKPGFLLDVASMLTGVGLSVMEADITSQADANDRHRRLFTFLVCDEHGGKLSTTTSNTVLYTLSIMMGKGHMPMMVPSASF